MSNTAPSTPEGLPRRIANRSFTLPPKTAKQAEIGASDGVETLYVHPRASIVKFTNSSSSSSSSTRPNSSAGSPRQHQPPQCQTSAAALSAAA